MTTTCDFDASLCISGLAATASKVKVFWNMLKNAGNGMGWICRSKSNQDIDMKPKSHEAQIIKFQHVKKSSSIPQTTSGLFKSGPSPLEYDKIGYFYTRLLTGQLI